ncbi:MAG: DUF1460 domain-containing protein [Rhodothermales bacterium]|nr:DUF1460 domain-containing protein [Rhodothermales bacterium]
MRKLHLSALAVTTVLLISGGLSCHYADVAVADIAPPGATPFLSVSGPEFDLEGPAADSRATATVRKPTALLDVLPQLDPAEVVTFDNLIKLARARTVSAMPLDSIIQWVGERFVGSEYVGGMLDQSASEELVVSLRKFDCVLFMETVLALSTGIKQADYSGAGFIRRLRKLRYRQGVMNGYASRLHYFSDWIHDNQSMGFVRDITPEIGGRPRSKTLNIMSKHRRLYKRLAKNDSLHQRIVEMEERLQNVPQYYIPHRDIGPALDLIKPGDIVSTATVARGLDVSHSGFAYRNPDGTIGLLHASSAVGEVTITRSLRDYVASNRFVEGIVVARATY